MTIFSITPIFYKIIKKEKFIKAARIYGSSLYLDDTIDIDIALLIPSRYGVVGHTIYKRLYNVRKKLCDLTGLDIDLIPHTQDEITNTNSPLWHPRYNPSLVFGKDIKAKFPIKPMFFKKSLSNWFTDMVAYNLYDTRCIVRRQALRSLNGEEARIFLAKMIHGPGNALVHLSLCNKKACQTDPSNIEESFSIFGIKYGLDMGRILEYFNKSKNIISKTGKLPMERALNILSWYELLIALILNNSPKTKGLILKKFKQYSAGLKS